MSNYINKYFDWEANAWWSSDWGVVAPGSLRTALWGRACSRSRTRTLTTHYTLHLGCRADLLIVDFPLVFSEFLPRTQGACVKLGLYASIGCGNASGSWIGWKPPFSRFTRTPTCDRQTDGQTRTHDGSIMLRSLRYSIAWPLLLKCDHILALLRCCCCRFSL